VKPCPLYFLQPGAQWGKKREIIRSFTNTASRLTGLDPSAFVVYIIPVQQDPVGVGEAVERSSQRRPIPLRARGDKKGVGRDEAFSLGAVLLAICR